MIYNTKNCDRGQVIHGSFWILLKIHKRILKDCKSNNFFAKEGSEI
jgi:hypothetical protein